jgi:hypothetical protein
MLTTAVSTDEQTRAHRANPCILNRQGLCLFNKHVILINKPPVFCRDFHFMKMG